MLYRVISRLNGKSREFSLKDNDTERAVANAQHLIDNFYVRKSGHTGTIWREGVAEVIAENGVRTSLHTTQE